jgi:hypothetical protein
MKLIIHLRPVLHNATDEKNITYIALCKNPGLLSFQISAK